MSDDPMRLQWDGDHLVLTGRNDWHEAICPECGEPIRWVLDMASFTSGFAGLGHRLAHARCVWTPEAFGRERRAAKAIQAAEVTP